MYTAEESFKFSVCQLSVKGDFIGIYFGFYLSLFDIIVRKIHFLHAFVQYKFLYCLITFLLIIY